MNSPTTTKPKDKRTRALVEPLREPYPKELSE